MYLKVLSSRLSLLDRLLAPLILLCMIVGVLIGVFVNGVQEAFNTVEFHGVSVPIAIGLIVMMWPTLTNVRYECLGRTLLSRKLWIHLSISLVLNWIIGPLVMLGLAWATMPDLPTYRTGVIMVGIARCIAMVMIWNGLAGGDTEYCAIIVVVNSVLQMALYSPYAVLFVDIGGAKQGQEVHLQYGTVAVSVLIYLGIPLLAGVVTRLTVLHISPNFFHHTFLPCFSTVSLLGLLYTILVLFAYQGHHIVHNIGNVARVAVPLILYSVLMWIGTAALLWTFSRRGTLQKCSRGDRMNETERIFNYEMAVVQAFTAASNNFELAIAVTIATYGVGSDQALAATIGTLVEVPVLLSLTWVAQAAKVRLPWDCVEICSDDRVEKA
ncbi:hypothetical protein SCLCIDRAFT_1223640 [Scleroderma citrinum Foug A]|uniref:Arsenical-resistance protein n=1 Tax=Scleroderma citrinum Foug A TaxID=1036808 RepID=A0A0C3D858_9AGAM|nr:hypothetical protein SCLCIDRAFT_1223640 [Scleroderma citrinum Foug A]